MINRVLSGMYTYLAEREYAQEEYTQKLQERFIKTLYDDEFEDYSRRQTSSADKTEKELINDFIESDPNIIKNFEKFREQFGETVAILDRKGLSKVAAYTDTTRILRPKKDFEFKDLRKQYADLTKADFTKKTGKLLTEIAQIHEEARRGQAKIQTGLETIARAVDVTDKINHIKAPTKSASGLASLQKAYKTFQETQKGIFYDLEVFGGRNIKGRQGIEHITEFAFELAGFDKQTLKKLGVPEGQTRISNIIGISTLEADSLRAWLEELKKTPIQAERDRIKLEQLIRYGEESFKYAERAPGIFEVLETAPSVDITNLKAAEKGVDFLEEIGYRQGKEGMKEGMRAWERQYLGVLDLIKNDKEAILFGHNIVEADNPWQSQYLAMENKFTKPAYAKARQLLGAKGTGVPTMPNLVNRYVDVLGTFQQHGALMGKSVLPARGATALQLGSIGVLAGIDYEKNLAKAHTAAYDAYVTRQVAEKVLPKMFSDIEQKVSSSKQFGSNLVLMADQVQNYYRGGKHALNFTKDAYSGALTTFSGFTVGPTGDFIEQPMLEVGFRRNALYTARIFELSITKDTIEDLQKLEPSLAQGKLYSVEFMPLVRKEADDLVKGSYGLRTPSYYFARSLEEVEGVISTFETVGKVKSGVDIGSGLISPADIDVIDDAKMWNERLALKTIGADNIVSRVIPKEERIKTLMQRGEFRVLNETTGRFISENRLDRIEGLFKIYEQVEDHLKQTVGETVSHKDVRNKLFQGLSKMVSEDVASNKILTIDNQLKIDLSEILGFGEAGNKTVYSQTISRILPALDYIHSQKEVIEEIRKNLGVKTSGDQYTKAGMQFDYAMREFQTAVAKEFKNSPALREKFLSRLPDEAKEFYAKDMNYMELDISDFIRSGKTVPYISQVESIGKENILRVGLGYDKEYSLIDQLLRSQGLDPKALGRQKDIYGLRVARDFVEHVRQSGRYGDLFASFTEKKLAEYRETTAPALGEALIQDMRRYVSDPANVQKSYLQQLIATNKLAADQATTILKQEYGSEYIKNIIDSIKTPNFTAIGRKGEALSDEVKRVVEDILMPDERAIKTQILEKFAGDPVKKQYLEHSYDILKRDQREWLQSLVGSFLKTGKASEVAFDRDTGKVFARYGEQITELTIPRVQFQGSGFVIDVGGNRYMAGMALDFGDYKRTRDSAKINVLSPIGKAWRKNVRGVNKIMRTAAEEGTQLHSLNYIMGKFTEGLREATAVYNLTPSEQMKGFELDYGGIVEAMPTMKRLGIIDRIPLRDDREFFMSTLKPLFDAQAEFKSYGDIRAGQREMLAKNAQLLLRETIADMPAGEQQQVVRFMIENLNLDTHETRQGMGIGMIGSYDISFSSFFGTQKRPTMTQASKYLQYDRKEAVERLARIGLSEEVALDGIFTSSSVRALMGEKIPGAPLTGPATITALNITDSMFKAIMSGEKLDKAIEEAGMASKSQQIKERLSLINLYEDEGYVDARLADSIAHRRDIQMIRAKQQINYMLETNIETNEYVQNLRKNVLPEIAIREGKIVLKLAEGERVARHDKLLDIIGYGDSIMKKAVKADEGILRFGALSKVGGIPLTSSEITQELNRIINVESLTGLSREDMLRHIYDTLDQHFVSGYYVEDVTDYGYAKYMLGGHEKFMASSVKARIGELDSYVRSELERIGRADLIGKSLSYDEINRALGNNKEIFEKIMQERYLYADIIRKTMAQEGTSPLVLTGAQIKKHGEGIIGAMSLIGFGVQKFGAQKVVEDLKRTGVINFDVKAVEGQIEYPSELRPGEDYINLASLQDLAEQEWKIADDIVYKSPTGRPIGTFLRSDLAHIEDWAGGSGAWDIPVDQRTPYSEALRKGVRFSQREIEMMKLYGYGQPMVRAMQDAVSAGRLTEAELFDVMGHAITKGPGGELMLRQGYEGRALMQPFIDKVTEMMTVGEGIKLKDVLEKSQGESYRYLSSLLDPIPEISLRRAEDIYGYAMGMHALAYNEGRGSMQELIQRRGFNVLGIDELDIARELDADDMLASSTSIHRQNIVVDFGEQFDSRRYVAIGRMPFRRLEDNVIKYETQQKLAAIQKQRATLQEMQTGKKVALQKEVDDLKRMIENNIDELKNIYRANVTSNSGLIDDILSAKLDASLIGKASGVLVLDPNKIEIEDILGPGATADSVLNYHALKKAKFKGTTLLEHYQHGRMIDAKFVSPKAAEALGFFNKENIARLGVKTEQEAAEIYQELGELGIDVRYPTIAEGSPKYSMYYLDPKLEGYRIKSMSYSTAAARGDYDGDLSYAVMARFNNNLYAQKNKAATTLEAYRDAEASLMYRAVSINPALEAEIQGKISDQITETAQVANVKYLAGERAIQDHLYAKYSSLPDQRTISDMNHILQKFGEKYGIGDPGTYNDRKAYREAIDKALLTAKNADDAQYKAFRQAAVHRELMIGFEESIVAKARKYSIGEANVPLYIARRFADVASFGATETNQTVRAVVQNVSDAIEQEVISAKQGNVIENVNNIGKLRNALDDLHKTGGAVGLRRWMDAQEGLEDALVDKGKQMAIQGYDEGLRALADAGDEKAVYDFMARTYTESLASITEEQARQIKASASIGIKQSGIYGRQITDALRRMPGDTSSLDKLMEHMEQARLIDSYQTAPIDVTDAQVKYEPLKALQGVERIAAERSSLVGGARSTVQFLGEQLAKFSEQVPPHSLAYGAMGIAGAIMLAGYVGGRPVKPADIHAMEEHDSDLYAYPSLSDPGPVVQQDSRGGYVININAQAAKNKKELEILLNQAIRESYGTNVNISMNIKDSATGNISDRQIERMIQNMF